MANQLFGNNLKTALSLSTAPGSLSGVATSVTLVAGGGNNWPTPSAGDYILVTLYEVNGLGLEINHEVVRVTNRTADTLTINARDFELAYSGVGRSFPDVPANNPSGTVYAALRYTAYAAGNTLNKDDNLSSIVNKTTARANLGVAIGTNVQAFSANLSEYAAVNPTPAGLALLDDADITAQRATLGLGTLATQSGTFSGTSSGTNTGDQNNFNTIAVSGQTSVVADATSDTLTLVAGTNVVITTNAATDAITVSVPNQIAANVTNTPSGNLAAANVQAALNELQTDVDTRATSVQLTAHIDILAAAHDASAISNAAAGNLTSTNVQASLAELQTDIDTRATSAALTSGLAAKANLASPTLTGVPAAPTAVVGTNTTQVATTAFVQAESADQLATATPAALGTAAVGAGTKFARDNHVHAMPTLDALANTTITAVASGELLVWNGTAWVNNTLNEAGITGLASPAFTGTPTSPTAAAGTNTTQLATTAFVQAAVPAASETVSGKIEIATSAEAIAGTDTVRAVTPASMKAGLNASGTAPTYACRAWVNFNGTGTVAIRASGNVSSITDNGTGDYSINLTAMADANYSAVVTAGRGAGDTQGNIVNITDGQTSSLFRILIRTRADVVTDQAQITCAVFR